MASMLASKQIRVCAQSSSRDAKRVVRCQASVSESAQSLASKVAACGLAATLMLSGVSSAQAADLRTLADVARPNFSFIDANKDGIVTTQELGALSRQIAQEEEFDAPKEELLAFSHRLFDLNQDGKVTTDEALTALTMDTLLFNNQYSADINKVFDPNSDGKVTLQEWSTPFGNLGRNGEEVKEYVFNRLDYLSDSDGKLNVEDDLPTALTLMRIQTLGY